MRMGNWYPIVRRGNWSYILVVFTQCACTEAVRSNESDYRSCSDVRSNRLFPSTSNPSIAPPGVLNYVIIALAPGL